jgi:hypothetical protein
MKGAGKQPQFSLANKAAPIGQDESSKFVLRHSEPKSVPVASKRQSLASSSG